MIQLAETTVVTNRSDNSEQQKHSTYEALFGLADHFELCVTDYKSIKDFMNDVFKKMDHDDLMHFVSHHSECLKARAMNELQKRGICL